jgi:hypothetical protein
MVSPSRRRPWRGRSRAASALGVTFRSASISTISPSSNSNRSRTTPSGKPPSPASARARRTRVPACWAAAAAADSSVDLPTPGGPSSTTNGDDLAAEQNRVPANAASSASRPTSSSRPPSGLARSGGAPDRYQIAGSGGHRQPGSIPPPFASSLRPWPTPTTPSHIRLHPCSGYQPPISAATLLGMDADCTGGCRGHMSSPVPRVWRSCAPGRAQRTGPAHERHHDLPQPLPLVDEGGGGGSNAYC